MSVSAFFQDNQIARFELEKNGATLSVAPKVNLSNFDSLEYFYQNTYTNHDQNLRLKKLEVKYLQWLHL